MLYRLYAIIVRGCKKFVKIFSKKLHSSSKSRRENQKEYIKRGGWKIGFEKFELKW